MKTAKFPSVLKAQNVVLRQVTFYRSMMEDDAPKTSAAPASRASTAHPTGVRRKKVVRKATAEV